MFVLIAVCLLAATGARANSEFVSELPDGADSDHTAKAQFLPLSGPPVALKWGDRIAFEISEESFKSLTAASKGKALHFRAYAGTKSFLKRKQAPDPYGCIEYYFEERGAIRVTRRRGTPFLETDVNVRRTWFDKPEDIIAVLVVDEGRLPEWSTRIHKTLVPSYFDSGIEISVSKLNSKGEVVNTDWKTAGPSLPTTGGVRVSPSNRQTTSLISRPGCP